MTSSQKTPQKYKVIDGTSFSEKTPDEVCKVLCKHMGDRDHRLRLFYGDPDTGMCWMEEYDTMGYIGRSMGPTKIPLLIHNKNSIGGYAILDSSILCIKEDQRVLYKHPKFCMPTVTVKGNQVFFDNKLHAEFKTPEQADRYAKFMRGERNRK